VRSSEEAARYGGDAIISDTFITRELMRGDMIVTEVTLMLPRAAVIIFLVYHAAYAYYYAVMARAHEC